MTPSAPAANEEEERAPLAIDADGFEDRGLLWIAYEGGLSTYGPSLLHAPSAYSSVPGTCTLQAKEEALVIKPLDMLDIEAGNCGGASLDLTQYHVRHITAVRVHPALACMCCLPPTAILSMLHYALINVMAAEDRSVLGQTGENILQVCMLALPVLLFAVFSRPAQADPASPFASGPSYTRWIRNGILFLVLYCCPVVLVTHMKRGAPWSSSGPLYMVLLCAAIKFSLLLASTLRVQTETAFALVPRQTDVTDMLLPPGTHVLLASSRAQRDAWVRKLAGVSTRGVLGVSLDYLRHLVQAADRKASLEPEFKSKYESTQPWGPSTTVQSKCTNNLADHFISPCANAHRASWYDAFLRHQVKHEDGPTGFCPRDAPVIPDVGPATTFVSHAWYDSFPDLVSTLEAHEKRVATRAAIPVLWTFSFDRYFRTGSGLPSRPLLLEERPKYYWMDIMFKSQCNAQQELSAADKEALEEELARDPSKKAALEAQEEEYSAQTEREFESSVLAMGCTYLIANGLSYGRVPTALTRVWCLYEVYSTLKCGAALTLVQNVDETATPLALQVDINMELAEGRKVKDTDRIRAHVRTSVPGGFAAVNARLKQAVYDGQTLFLEERAAVLETEFSSATASYRAACVLVVFSVFMGLSAWGSYRLGEPEAPYSLLMFLLVLGAAKLVGEPAHHALQSLRAHRGDVRAAREALARMRPT